MKHAFAPLVLVLIVAGCRGVEPPSRGRGDLSDHRRLFLDTTHRQQLQRSTAVDVERIGRDQFNLLTVTLSVRNTREKPLALEYNYEFFDAAGRSVEGPLGWKRLNLTPGTPGTIQFTSTSEAAEDYRLSLRFQR